MSSRSEAARARRLGRLVGEIAGCRICRDAPDGAALPHQPRPVLAVSPTARIGIFGQAPGTRVHASGVPFTDPSGDRLRTWLGVTSAEFYDASRIAIVPMGFCFPGLDAGGGDLPPRPECARVWRSRLMAELGQIELLLLVGQHAQRWHLGTACRPTLTATVADWRRYFEVASLPRALPLPHPSWRNSGWLKANPWFERELLAVVRPQVRGLL